jgi:stearoyl-CoA desaturase (delta-9 desaturase)
LEETHIQPESPNIRARTLGHNLFVARVVNLGLVLIPFAALVVAITLLWGVALSWPHLAVFGGMYLLTVLGITVGYHRYFTHRSFKTSKPIAALLAFLGSMAVEGPLMNWVADHRRHHQHSDEEGDPHSPQTHGSGMWGMLKGMWHAHMGWLFGAPPTGRDRYIGDLRKSRMIRWMSNLFPLWVVVGLAIPAVLGGLLTMSWLGVLLGFIWGGLVRVFFVHHVTWSVNSICHLWGTRPFKSRDESCNNAVFGVLALGEGWHNNHHAFPTSARHGLRWWEVDASYMVIWAMSKVGLAWDVRVPSPARIAAKHR